MALAHQDLGTSGEPLTGMVKQPGRREHPVDVQAFPARHRTRPGAILGVSLSLPCSVDQFSFGSFPKSTTLLLTGWSCSFPPKVIQPPDHPFHGSQEVLSTHQSRQNSLEPEVPPPLSAGKEKVATKTRRNLGKMKGERFCSVGAVEERPNLVRFVKYPSFSSCHSTPSKIN